MRTPSVYIAEELMPYLRARIAEGLYREGMTQARIAEYLGITQAMVSKYLSGKYKRPPEEISGELDSIAREIVRVILLGGERSEIIVLATRRLFELFQSGVLCRFYGEYSGIDVDTCRSLFSLADNRSGVLETLSRAISWLSRIEGFTDLIPEVRSNFAYALSAPASTDDVAAVPGRITSAKGRLFALPPEFGASSFTAGILVEVGKLRPEVRSVLNIRAGEDVESALRRSGFSFAVVRTGGLSEGEAIATIARPFGEAVYDAVVDEGGEGVEPLVYIFGRDPFEVVEKLKKLVDAIEASE